MLDLKITGGQILDGTGAPSYVGDVGIRDGQIEALAPQLAEEAKAVFSAAGKCVCPGFIDAHSHSDAYLLIEPSAPSKITQGVTTEITGNCGASAAPRTGAYQMPSDWREKNYPAPWSSVQDYRELLEEAKPAVNVVLLIGHNSIRAGVMGYEGKKAGPDELRAMVNLLTKSLDEGGAGFSTGLIYPPGMFADYEELVVLARTAGSREKIYATHMRSEGKALLPAIDEALSVGREAGVRVQISHLKTAGKPNWRLIGQALDKIRNARTTGVEVAADRYPYTSSCTDLDVVLPDWASEGGRDAVLARLKEPDIRRRIRENLLISKGADYWNGVTIATIRDPLNKRFQGKPIVEIAKELRADVVDTVLHLIRTDELHTTAMFAGMSEENMWKILAEPWVMLGSDASIRSPEGPLGEDHPHPRAYGTFPRFLRAAIDRKTVTLEEAVRKMTWLPAEQFRLKDRGILVPGKAADVVIFDPAKVRDVATYETPHRFSEGIETVLVNGVVTVEEGRITGNRGGKFLD